MAKGFLTVTRMAVLTTVPKEKLLFKSENKYRGALVIIRAFLIALGYG
jgi:hypothetical protein